MRDKLAGKTAIPTNLISITDGQIYLSPDLFQKAIFTAIDVDKSADKSIETGKKLTDEEYQAILKIARQIIQEYNLP
ncbi:MAG: hypothetical protein HC836_05165 [Richelia sp. RM2_1_2]|nr:hypothetical protein [Richelia sp. SM1_7_0]NJN09903.1 hypothetical protein [Richelia sp. RM1_1_1]NJO26572.1 hypothetical protein [Richelia sp. SL_2_1]NJO57769.1 hypothetical protein [Richelia sp. RM2_1_2]NJS16148.1 hypothetical protein [Nostocaceae cyanobacterium CSU_2_110]